MKVLFTGFTPFGGETINPAWEALKRLPPEIAGAQVICAQVPTAFHRAWPVLKAAIEVHKPDLVLCVGQAGGRSQVTVEKVAVNWMDARIPDEAGAQPVDQPVCPGSAPGYFACVPVRAMVRAVERQGIPAAVSYTAGTFVCNCLLYQLLAYIGQTAPTLAGGFIHVPYAPCQLPGKPAGTPAMEIPVMADAIAYAAAAALKEKTHTAPTDAVC